MKEVTYADRTDSFDEKLRLMEAAWKKGDYRLVRALASSIRDTAIQQQQENEELGAAVAPAGAWQAVTALPAAWQEWARGWSHYLSVATDETVGSARPPEPVEVVVTVPQGMCRSLARELRVARVENGILREIPCQVNAEARRGEARTATLLFMASSPAHARTHYLVLAGNPDAELPEYKTDLETRGEGYALDIENDFYRARLSRQMGQLERLTFKREHGLELFAGGEGHGEPPCIDWAHDYVGSGNFQKFRITLWERCPDYEVVRGPLCTVVRRWGFPHSPVHPVFSPSRIHMDIEYRFYAGLPWFHKIGKMEAIKAVEAEALRDDEWVFSGQSFRDMVWLGADGKLRTGEVEARHADELWGVGFVNQQAKDAFIALYLEHRAEGLPRLRHSGSPLFFYRWHGHVWSRYPLPGKEVPAGAVLRQKNAYLVLHYADNGAELVEGMRHRLVNPLVVSAAPLPANAGAKAGMGRLARAGEAGDSPISKRALWEALEDCRDEQLYATMPSVVDLGLIYDLRVRGDAVQVVMTMPHRGRPLHGYFSYGSGGNSMPIRQRLLKVPGVRRVVVDLVWEPRWSSNRLSEKARRAFGLPE